MARFSISDIERFTGIKAHTLRIWEQRYNLLIPRRTETKIRYYDDDDLKLLLNVSILMNFGYRISQIAGMGTTKISEKVLEHTENLSTHPNQIKALTAAMLALDEEAFNKIINTCILQSGLEITIYNIIFPFMNKIGVLWMTGTIHPANEHFITNLIKQKLYVAIEGQTQKPVADARKFLLYLPEGETHELGLLFANYLLRNRQQHVVYLGQMTPEEDITGVFEFYKPDCIFTSVTNPVNYKESMYEFLSYTSDLWKGKPIYITGQQIMEYKGILPANMKIVKEITDLTSHL